MQGDSGILMPEQEEQMDRERPPLASSPQPLPDGIASNTDSANTHRLLALFGADMRFCPELGGWFIFDGRRWHLNRERALILAQEASKALLIEAADALADAIRRLARAMVSGDDAEIEKRKRLKDAAHSTWTWARSSQNARGLKATLEIAEAHARATPNVFDADPYLLNVANGTIDLRVGAMREHRRVDMITKISPTRYEGIDAKHPVLDGYLDWVCRPHPELREFLERMAGLALIGANPQEAFFVVWGGPGSGKSTWLDALACMLGDYACTADVSTFLAPMGSAKGAGDARPDLAKLAGRRLVICSEVPRGRRFDEALVKKLTSDTITARKLYRDEFEFSVTFKVMLSCNDAPKISPDEEAIWRRLHLVPLDRVVPEADRDPEVRASLRRFSETGPAILAMAVRGALAVLASGLKPPACVREATRAYQDSQNPLKEFIEGCCILDPHGSVAGPILRGAYEEFAKAEGRDHILGPDAFGKRIAALGGQVKNARRPGIDGVSRPVKTWFGIRLRTARDDIDALSQVN